MPGGLLPKGIVNVIWKISDRQSRHKVC